MLRASSVPSIRVIDASYYYIATFEYKINTLMFFFVLFCDHFLVDSISISRIF